MRRTRLVIADRYPVVLQGLTSLFAAHYDFKIVASCRDGRSCVEAMRTLAPHVVLLDIAMPELTGLEILAIANAEKLPARLVFFTASIEHGELVAATAAGTCSIVPKDAEPEILVQSLRQASDGRRLPPPQRNAAAAENVLAVLTDREREIMRLVSEGLSNKAIARRLHISHGTIKVHLHHMYQKLGINNRTVLAALAISRRQASTFLRLVPKTG
jgi:DNA-binding NarL/FixJ family response regulator